MKLVLLGAPGSGKGTQAKYLCERLSVPAISTGAILRKAISDGTELGEEAAKYITVGKLVPDELALRIIDARLREDDCSGGFILDGYPRTIYQAEELEKIARVDMALSIEVQDAEILRRMTGRRNCPKCGATYHTEANPPLLSGICDVCGTKLQIRADDTPETVKKRLVSYHEVTEPIKEYYSRTDRLISVIGQGTVEEIRDTIFEALSL